MIFHIIGIKEISWKNYNLDFLMEWDSEDDIRSLLGKNGIVVININQFQDEIQSFGKTKIEIIDANDQHYTIIDKDDEYKKIYFLYSFIGFTIEHLAPLSSDASVTEEALLVQIQEWKQQLDELRATELEHKGKKDEASSLSFKLNDTQIPKMQEFAELTVQKAQNILSSMKDKIPPQMLNNLNTLSQELSKLKLWTNTEKIKVVANEIIVLLNTIQKQQIDELKENEYLILEDSVVTNVDVAREVQRWEKAEEIKQVGGATTKNDKFYISLWKSWIYLKFLFKDMLKKISQVDTIVLALFNLLWIGIYTSTVFFWLYNVYVFYNHSIGNITWFIPLAEILIDFWIASCLYLILRIVVKKNILWIVLGVIISTVLYFFIRYLVANTLSF